MAESTAEQAVESSSAAVEETVLLGNSRDASAGDMTLCIEDASAGAAALRWTRIVVPTLLGAMVIGACLFGTLRASTMDMSPNLASSHESKAVVFDDTSILHPRHIMHSAGLCLDVDEVQPGAVGRLQNCDLDPAVRQQRFTYEKVTGAFVNAGGLCLDASEPWACVRYEDHEGESNEWCQGMDGNALNGTEYKYSGGNGDCGECWCCQRQEADRDEHRLHFTTCDLEKQRQRWALDESGRFRPLQGRTAEGDAGVCLTAVNHKAIMRACSLGDAGQEWRLHGDEIRNGEHMCLHVQAPDEANGLAVVQMCENMKHKWAYRESTKQITVGSPFCLSAPTPGHPSGVQLDLCNATDLKQRFWLYSSGQLATQGYVDFASQPCATGWLQSAAHDSVQSCFEFCVETAHCEFFAFCPSDASFCTGQNANNCALYSSCDSFDPAYAGYSTHEMKQASGLCMDTAHPDTEGGEIHLWDCDASNTHQQWRVDGAEALPGSAPEPPPEETGDAPVFEFYMYRAVAEGALDQYPFGNINTGNMAGVMWYLQNEVVTKYSGPMACPRKFNIHELHRFKVKVKATIALASEGHYFGARFAYDRGQCVGRCFPGNQCTCTEECDDKFAKYGFVVGCNNFYDKYPFPDMETTYPSGVWYSLPIEGKCDEATGAHDCTWSWEDAGSVTLAELEGMVQGNDQCCDGLCTNFWTGSGDYGSASWRVQQALDLFHRKYPDMPPDPNTQGCDFNRDQWYSEDSWNRRDPWSRDGGCMRDRFDNNLAQPFAS